MAEQTTNFGFTKPDANEFYNVGVQNENWDKVDKLVSTTIAVLDEADLDAKLLAIFRTMPIECVKFVQINSSSASLFSGGSLIATLKKVMDLGGDNFYGTVEMSKYSGQGIEKYQKQFLGGEISPLEYENPPLELDKEYRTTERWMGKPVYRKLFDFGSMPNKTYKTMSYYPTWDEVQPVSAVGILNSGGTHTVLPTVNYSGTSGEISLKVQSNNITISASSDIDMTGKTAYVDVRYVYA